jgi:hypothetical protein
MIHRLVNEQGNALVAVGSSDGTVRLWRNVFEENASLLTAWTSGLRMLKVNVLYERCQCPSHSEPSTETAPDTPVRRTL